MEKRLCRACSKELNPKQKYYCSNDCKLKDPAGIAIRTKPKEKQDSSKLIRCKITGKTFKDISNYSGVLTRHIETLNCSTDDIFSNFEIIDNPDFDKPKYHCKYCEWTSVDTKNVSGWITLHISKKHGIEISDHVKSYPEETDIFKYGLKNKVRQDYFDNNDDAHITCLECGERFKKISSTHLQKHNITPTQYRLKHNLDTTMSPVSKELARDHYFKNFDAINSYIKESEPEKEVSDFIESLGIKVIKSNRKIIHPLEIDIFLPEYNIAIEYDGLAWHSEFFGKKDRNYHLMKTKICEEKGIRLIHIFDDEWRYKKEIVKNKLLSILGKSEKRIFARKCEVKYIADYIKNDFLNKNHIQGEDRSQVHLGMFFQDELVAVMTFSKPRIQMGYKGDNDGMFELSRFATSIPVVGAASKLLSFFIKNHNPIKIITFADRRWTSLLGDSMYDKIGFKKVKINKPNYWYIINGRERKHRYGYNKFHIVEKLGGDRNLTEVENMRRMGYDRIWDCGTVKYELILTS